MFKDLQEQVEPVFKVLLVALVLRVQTASVLLVTKDSLVFKVIEDSSAKLVHKDFRVYNRFKELKAILVTTAGKVHKDFKVYNQFKV